MFHARCLYNVITTVLIVLLSSASNSSLANATLNELNSDIRKDQRSLYLKAKKAFSKRDLRYYQQLKRELENYPLHPYLVYNELSYNLDVYQAKRHTTKTSLSKNYQKTTTAIKTFLEKNKGSYLEKRLRTKWLKHLAATKNWKLYVQHYQPYIKNTKLRCHYWKALYLTQKTFEKDAVKNLWLVGKSQPDECDFIFKKWAQKGHLTQDLLWKRHKLAIGKGKYGLAHYLQGKMKKDNQYLATLYEKIHRNPSTIKNVKRFKNYHKNNTNKSYQKLIDIIYNGIYRHAYRDPESSLAVFSRLKNVYQFSNQEEEQLLKRIASRLISAGEIADAKPLLANLSIDGKAQQIERLLRHYLAMEDWQKIVEWIDHLPETEANSERWQYWKAKSFKKLGKSGYQEIFQTVAKTRGYYGFLSADILKIAYEFEDKPAPVELETIKRIKSLPAIQRSYEFYQLKELHRARIEWSYAIEGFSTDEFIAVAQLAHLWGWNRKAIESMAAAKYWDDLTIRFPVVHQQIIDKKANHHNLSNSLIFSIARQESAWEYDARSRVGARGLMQIMPATAKQTAKRAKIRYSKRKLFEPEYNITLGSFYINQLLNQHNNNRPLAIASYNAGPHRVKRWLAKSNSQLDVDTWIETIPFKETRKYVQNVLSYEVIYNYRQGHYSKLLTLAEANANF